MMAAQREVPLYVVIESDLVAQLYEDGKAEEILAALKQQSIGASDAINALNSLTDSAVYLPSRRWVLEAYGLPRQASKAKALMVGLPFAALGFAQKYYEYVEKLIGGTGKAPKIRFVGIGSDLAFGVAEHWCPSGTSDALFGDRQAAERLMRSDHLGQNGLRGQGVNIIVVDQGFDESLVGKYGGRWWNQPSPPPAGGSAHGNRTVRNLMSLAPEATYYDLPLVPSMITSIPQYVSDAQAAYETVRQDIDRLRTLRGVTGPWVMVNAWAIFNRGSELNNHDYTENPGHPFNLEVANMDAAGVDMVFAAGNCGNFCSNPRCKEKGPGKSIFGANAHANVLTVGAVRADRLWLGYSSQGPGAGQMARSKPDLCAPSQFREDDDANSGNTGTSTSCALAAGAVAALRSRWDAATISTAAMRRLLRSTAKPLVRPDPKRHGSGILDARAAYERAVTQFP